MTIVRITLATLFTLGISTAQTAPKAGLIFVQNISIPTWTATGANQANYDPFNFNPQTRIMYLADRVNQPCPLPAVPAKCGSRRTA
jgi:hypothetical protein